MIRISGYPIGNIYFNELEITKAYAGQFQVFPDQQIENTFWLKVTKNDASIVYCWCRQTAKIVDSQGNITELRYEVIQTQNEEPGEEYYELLQSIYIEENTSGVDYTNEWSMMDKTPDEIYALIPEITQKILIKGETLSLYKYGVLIENMEGVYFGAGKTTDYDRMEFFFRPVNYGGASWFGVINAPSDNNDFRLFGASNYIYFDCGSGRIYKARITNSYMLKVTLVSGGTCSQYYYNGTAHQNDIGTSKAFSSYTGSSKDILLGVNSFYFYGFNGYKDNVLLDSIIVPDSYVEQGIYNKLYNIVKNEYITLSITPTAIQTNSYPYVIQNTVYSHGNILDDFSLNPTSQNVVSTKNGERCSFNYKTVLVTDSINEMNYDTTAKYITAYTYYTQDPTIIYDQASRSVQVYGNGTLYLLVNGVSVNNPYILSQNASDTTYSISAYAQESGKYNSNTVTKTITVSGYKTATPSIVFNNYTGTVSVLGNGTIQLYIDGVLVANPYTLPELGTYTATATAQEAGKQISDTATLSIEYTEITALPFINFNKVDSTYKTITNIVLDNTTVLTCRYYRTANGNTASLFGCSDNTGGTWERSVKTCVYRDNHLYFGGAGLYYPVSNNEPHTIVVSYIDGTIEVDGTQVYSGMTISNNTCAKFALCFFYHTGTQAIDATTSNGQYINSFEYKHGNDVYLVEVDNDGLVTHTLNGTVQKSVQTTVDIFA